jgi:SAM-dependent methyltransferase
VDGSGAPARKLRIEEVDPADAAAVAEAARLHLELLAHGPMARLGELFLRRFCYTVLLQEDLMRTAICRVDGEAAGFVAYTARSITFHRDAIRTHALELAAIVLRSIAAEPRILWALPKALWLMRDRRDEISLGSDPLGEVVAIGVLPRFARPAFTREIGVSISEALVRHAAGRLRRAGAPRMRMIVEAHNKAPLFLYHRLGARFEPYTQIGEPRSHVWFDLDERWDDPGEAIPEVWAEKEATSSQASGWSGYWEGLQDRQRIFRSEATDTVRRLFSEAPLPAGARVLDFGCGFGLVGAGLARRGCEVWLWDASPHMRKLARMNAAHVAGVHFADLSRPEDLPPLRFDLVLVNSVAQYMPDAELDAWLTRWARLLAPGGRIVIADLLSEEASALADWRDFTRHALRGGFLLRAVREGLAEIARYRRMRGARPLRRLSRGELSERAERHGLHLRFADRNVTYKRRRATAVLDCPSHSSSARS